MTPADIGAQQFRIALRGYAVDEVDAFLDTVETELSRLVATQATRAHPPCSSPLPAWRSSLSPRPAPRQRTCRRGRGPSCPDWRPR